MPVGRIDANPDQPRLTFDEGALAELSSSVKEHGVLQPILVRPDDGGRYQLIAGERRWRAAKMANLETIPAMIEEIDDDTALEIAIIENLQREDLSPLDEAIMYDRMTSEHGYSVRKLAQKLEQGQGLHRESTAPRPMRHQRSASSCLCAKTPSRTPTSCSRSRIHGNAAVSPSRSLPSELQPGQAAREDRGPPIARSGRRC